MKAVHVNVTFRYFDANGKPSYGWDIQHLGYLFINTGNQAVAVEAAQKHMVADRQTDKLFPRVISTKVSEFTGWGQIRLGETIVVDGSDL